jgi:Mg-chelatase subunit ChlD
MQRLRLSSVKDKDLLKYEIVRKKTSKAKYEQLANNLGFQDVKEMTRLAVNQGNIDALMGIANSNVWALTAELASSPEYSKFFSQKDATERGSNFIPQLYFMVRTHAPKNFKILLKRLTRSIILRSSLKISGRGSKGTSRQRSAYIPGNPEFDVEETIHNYIQASRFLSYSDIVAIKRRQKKRNIVLILDTSGSMFGKLLMNAALTTSVLSYAMSKDYTSVVLFAQDSYVLKNIEDESSVTRLIDMILESEAIGFTNISAGLRKALEQLNMVKGKGGRKSYGILISDGDYNRGINPASIAKLFPRLDVIGMPPEEVKDKFLRGQEICKDIAKNGRGSYYPVKRFEEIPRVLMELLSKY